MWNLNGCNALLVIMQSANTESKGGTDHLNNFQTLKTQANRKKGNKTL